MTTMNPGMVLNPSNNFLILDSYEDTALEDIALDCDIKLGENHEEAVEILSAMKAEEQAREAVAEAIYRRKLEEKMRGKHSLEGENLELVAITNDDRGVDDAKTGEQAGKRA